VALSRNEEINEKMDIETELLYALRMMVAALDREA